MKLIVTIGALGVSSGLHAGPITLDPDIIDVEYWGSISDSTAEGHSVGDAVHGTMRIDLRLGITDYEYFTDARGVYGPNAGFKECPRNCGPGSTEPSAFVTSRAIRDLGGLVFDQVQVQDGALASGIPPPTDSFEVTDEEYGAGGAFHLLSVGVDSPVDFITGDALLQSFDLRLSESGGSARGVFESFLDGASSFFVFAIDRIRATPRVCRI
jgi:hypothetical protein